jgi:hypothetical protein
MQSRGARGRKAAILSGCKDTAGKFAFLQMATNIFTPCADPQISMLDELHQEHPNATFVLNFRPINDWMASTEAWLNLTATWRVPGCFDRIPGLIITQGGTDDQLHMDSQRWWCSHIQHIRAFVKQHPSHKLIQLDLYDETGSAATMASLFHAETSCWGHKNKNMKLKKKANSRK